MDNPTLQQVQAASTDISRLMGVSADEASTALMTAAGWQKPPASQFEEVMGATEFEVAAANMPPDCTRMSQDQLLRRLQLQYRYAAAVIGGKLKPVL